jgi:glycosyltransferase involved in cell wall biosynthesis
MTRPISVVLCTYNGSLFLAEQVRSILLQTYPITELIIADDASTDNTYSLIQELARNDARIKFTRNESNLGFSANFSNAMSSTSCELIAISDQDDIWHERKLETLVFALEDTSSLIYCNSIHFQGQPIVDPVSNPRNRHIEGNDPKKIAVFNTISGHAMLIRKSLLGMALPVPAGVYYDWWLALWAMTIGEIQFVPEVLVQQRSHENNVTIQKHLSESDLRKQFRLMLNTHLANFTNIGTFKPSDQLFFKELNTLWAASLKQKLNWKLFIFLMRHRHNIFYYKLRAFPIISQFKHCFLFSFRFQL